MTSEMEEAAHEVNKDNPWWEELGRGGRETGLRIAGGEDEI